MIDAAMGRIPAKKRGKLCKKKKVLEKWFVPEQTERLLQGKYASSNLL